MTKYIYLIRGNNSESYQDFKKRIMAASQAAIGQCDVLKLTITEREPPKFSVIPYEKTRIAVISAYHNGDSDVLPVLTEIERFTGVYRVTEALPVQYEKTWPDGDITPGVCLLTLFRKKKNLDYDVFIDRWHNGHTPLSLKIHPLWHYNRNVVEEKLSSASEDFDGIVEEHCRTPSELFNPFKFFGKPLIVIPRMISVYRDVRSFIDYPSIESYLVSEYFLKSK